MTDGSRHLAHFNWATLKADSGSPEVAGFEDAIARVNAIAERSPGFVWRNEAELQEAREIGWPMFLDDERAIASFSVWQSPAHLKDFVYNTVHGAFYRRSGEWFLPGAGVKYALWWVDTGQIPSIGDARSRVEHLLADGPSDRVFDFTYLEGAE